jgi:hypothetical protein
MSREEEDSMHSLNGIVPRLPDVEMVGRKLLRAIKVMVAPSSTTSILSISLSLNNGLPIISLLHLSPTEVLSFSLSLSHIHHIQNKSLFIMEPSRRLFLTRH